MSSIKAFLRGSRLHRWVLRRRSRAILQAWESSGRQIPGPPAFKQALIRRIAQKHKIRVLVETGTFHGGTLMACLDDFSKLYSVELSSELYELAQRSFGSYKKITLLKGNSATELPKILSRLSEPTLFWLDAHYSGEGTARAEADTPISKELQAIFRHPVKKHIILIDDARCFNGSSGYPTVDEMKSECPPTWQLSVESDVIILEPQCA